MAAGGAAGEIGRRTVVRGVLAAGALGLAARLGLLRAVPALAAEAGPYGPLEPIADRTTGLPLLRLPAGFTYASFGWTGDRLDDGHTTPGGHDGMAVVRAGGSRVWLVRNHELGPGAVFGAPEITYDARSGGGTTTLTFDTERGAWEGGWASLAGTILNCAGSSTPWHTWLSCEETVVDLRRPHGFVFEVPAPGVAVPRPLPALGRFVHEAAAVDPASGIVYETEDRETAGFYRFLPTAPANLARGGRLQMLRVKGRAKANLGGAMAPGTSFDVDWVDIGDPTRAHSRAGPDGLGVFQQGRTRGGASFRRLEGCCIDRGRVVFTSTTGGAAGKGQLWEYTPAEGRLRLLWESARADTLIWPDGVSPTPAGALILCQDAPLVSPQRLYCLSALAGDGRPFPLIENALVLRGERNGIRGDFRGYEWAGATFHGRWLFANIQKPGVTFAITGPWEQGPV